MPREVADEPERARATGPRLLDCRLYDEGVLVATPGASWLIADDDDEGWYRLAALIRIELHGRTAGNC
jgi:hypothetical protein